MAWDEAPWVCALKDIHQHHPNAPLLHGENTTIRESKPFVIQDFTIKFDDLILLVKVSHNIYPIDTAVEKGLPDVCKMA